MSLCHANITSLSLSLSLQALYDAVLGELGVQSTDVRAVLKEKWLSISQDCSVTDIVKSCGMSYDMI